MSLEPAGAAGDLVQGALLARVAEPPAGEALHSSAPSHCLNCGAPLTTRYCGDCGQSAHVHTTLHSIAHDLLHGLFHFEGKIWRTAPDLLIRPGELTRRYIVGERAKFVSPLALFLFAAFLMFAAFESVGGPFHPHAEVVRNGQRLSPAEVTRYLAQAQSREAELRRQLAVVPAGSPAAKTLRAQIDDAHGEAEGLAVAARFNAELRAPTLDRLQPVTGWVALDRRISAATANPPLLAVRLQANARKFAWALIPLSVPFLWIAFGWRREYRLYDHTVFIIYALSAAMLLFVVLALLSAVGFRPGGHCC